MNEMREKITAAAAGAAGDALREMEIRGVSDGSVANWSDDGSGTRPGRPESTHCEVVRKVCGALFNSFWLISHCCVHQMLMKDTMHQIDLGVIVHLIITILKKC